ncbi:his operon leader peptide [Escherichia coli]
MTRVQFKHHHHPDQSFRRCVLEDIQIFQWCMNA